MEDIEYSFWEIHYTSCEGNKRWTIARAPYDWDDYQVRERVQMGGYGDDPADLQEIFQTGDEDYSWDFTE